MTSDRVKECSPGGMDEFMTENGKTESSMEEESLLKSMAQERSAFGRMAAIFSGSATITKQQRHLQPLM